MSYAWTFGDGASGTGASGTYTASLTVTDSNGATTTVSKTVTATVPVVTPPPPPPPPAPPPTNVPPYTGKITSFALPAVSAAPFNSLKGSKHTNMASDGKRIYVSGGDWVTSATDGTWSMSLADGTWRQDVGAPVYPTLPAPHALQDGAGFEWVASRGKFLLWPGSYFAYDPAGSPILEYAKEMWWFDPVTNTYQQELAFLWGGGRRFAGAGEHHPRFRSQPVVHADSTNNEPRRSGVVWVRPRRGFARPSQAPGSPRRAPSVAPPGTPAGTAAAWSGSS